MKIGFDRIDPTPPYAEGVTLASFAGLPWKSRAAIVTRFKENLKVQLRTIQCGLCCYCRRLLPADPQDTDLEHIIEKAAHPAFTFEIRNLALSCSTCNGKKNQAYALLCGKLTKRASKLPGGGLKVVRCPVLSSTAAPITITSSTDFRWVHPHLDVFTEHISVQRGYIYQRRTLKGHRTIKGLDLNVLGRVEHRAAVERLSLRTGKLSMAIGLAAQLQFHTPAQVYSIAAEIIRNKLSTA
ncbi:HNH endonuclease [Ensifer adhaerens]